MNAIMLASVGRDFELQSAQIDVPCIVDNQVLVKVEYAGLAALDERFAVQGTACWQYPRIFGFDAVGIVVDAPKGMHPTIGTRVMWHNDISSPGIMCEYASVANYALTVLPQSVDPALAASVPSAGMTALIALYKLQLNEGESVFIEAGHTCIGQLAIQFAKQQGLTVFTSSTVNDYDKLKRLGADAVFSLNDENLSEQIQRQYGYDGVQGVVDCTGQNTNQLISLLQFCGRISCVSGLSQLDDALLFKKAPNIGVVSLPGAWLAKSICAQQRMSFLGNVLIESLEQGQLHIEQHQVLEFDTEVISKALQQRINEGSTTFSSIKIA
jgi:NADPH:quinone reductase-like Zn-dependent oxidoreductase